MLGAPDSRTVSPPAGEKPRNLSRTARVFRPAGVQCAISDIPSPCPPCDIKLLKGSEGTSRTMKLEAYSSSETSVNIYQPTWRHVP